MKALLTTLLIFNLLFLNAQHKRIERQQDIGSYIAIGVTSMLTYGIVYYAQPYIFFDGEFNKSEQCANLALIALAGCITLNRYDGVIPFEIELNNDPNPKYFDDLELMFSMQFQKWKPQIAVEYFFFKDWINVQYGVGYEIAQIKNIIIEPGARLGISDSRLGCVGYLKESIRVKRFSLVLYQRVNSNSLGNYYDSRFGINYNF